MKKLPVSPVVREMPIRAMVRHLLWVKLQLSKRQRVKHVSE